jgi:putative two-component system response regulator
LSQHVIKLETENESAPFRTLKKHFILLVEDEDFQREYLAACLKEWGLNILEAKDGDEAIEILKNYDNIRLIISDLNMPGLSGINLIKAYKSLHKLRLYIVVVSGISNRNTLIKCLDAGAMDYIIKPYHPEQIFARLATIDEVMSLENRYQEQILSLFDVMGDMLGSRDPYTQIHSLRVAFITHRIANVIGLTMDEKEILELGSLIHDIGKIAIPDDILLKPSRFDNLDRQIMNLHPVIGARFIAPRYADDRVISMVMNHHERLNGTGYPNKIHGDEIDIFTRILSMADVYEALISKRPYKKPMNKEKAFSIIIDEAMSGCLDLEITKSLKEAMIDWDPLTINMNFFFEIEAIEAFKSIAYFREPLCSFYNYRFLFNLDKTVDFSNVGKQYHLILIHFENLKCLNIKHGYLKVDTDLDRIGEDINSSLNDFDKIKNQPIKSFLFRRRQDYIIFTGYQDDNLSKFFEMIGHLLSEGQLKYELKGKITIHSYHFTIPIQKALSEFPGFIVQ